MKKVIIGQEHALEALIVCCMAGGHALLEGVPGVAKTLMVKALASSMEKSFRRIQFTPDLMPSDVVGTHIYDMKTHEFRLEKGPVFTDFLLADEINRTPPKTQAALLEAMEERQVTIEGETQALPHYFMVCATQNPLEYEGTYPLPEAQLDRFMMKILMSYPSFNEEREIVRKHQEGFSSLDLEKAGIRPIPESALQAAREAIARVRVTEPLMDYAVEIVSATRKNRNALLGASPRGPIHLLACARAYAALLGRDYVNPDDIKSMSLPVLRHRIIIRPEADMEGVTGDDVIRGILKNINVPR